jgi:hypothetical protein
VVYVVVPGNVGDHGLTTVGVRAGVDHLGHAKVSMCKTIT